ncbi:MAG: phosphate ABC transporter permease [Gloeocapsa sp. DLM2.Bin57]|nr:MAG: phosphate ABC transporter permease [Gloeocapsa sp. DLM2.Bin57]
MLIPLTRATFEEIIPLIATGPQYLYYSGQWQKILKQLLISLVGVVTIWLVFKLFGHAADGISLVLRIIAGLYWLWGPVYLASMRNQSYRRYPYSGFLRARIVDVYITEELIREEQSVNQRGELVIIENKEKRINLEIEDETGFFAQTQAPLKRIHKVIKPGQIAECLVLSKQPNLAIIDKTTDIYIPQHNLWIGDYPYLRRDIFKQVSQSLTRSKTQRRSRY